MTQLEQHLIYLAHHYNKPEFVQHDPVQFPHRYKDRRDIEVSAFVTAWISWGNRKQIIKTAEKIDTALFCSHPYDYLVSECWAEFRENNTAFYRTARYAHFCQLMARLNNVYAQYGDLESAVVAAMKEGRNPAEAISHLFRGIHGIADAAKGSPCKRLWFFLRWMVRRDGIVDLGIWQRISPRELIIPLDTHVFHVARHLKIISRCTADFKAAQEITDFFRKLFPEDPAIGDFALFGYGVENRI